MWVPDNLHTALIVSHIKRPTMASAAKSREEKQFRVYVMIEAYKPQRESYTVAVHARGSDTIRSLKRNLYETVERWKKLNPGSFSTFVNTEKGRMWSYKRGKSIYVERPERDNLHTIELIDEKTLNEYKIGPDYLVTYHPEARRLGLRVIE